MRDQLADTAGAQILLHAEHIREGLFRGGTKGPRQSHRAYLDRLGAGGWIAHRAQVRLEASPVTRDGSSVLAVSPSVMGLQSWLLGCQSDHEDENEQSMHNPHAERSCGNSHTAREDHAAYILRLAGEPVGSRIYESPFSPEVFFQPRVRPPRGRQTSAQCERNTKN